MAQIVLANSFSVAVIGASGNVGRELLRSLQKDQHISRIVVLNRRKIDDFSDNTKIEQVCCDF